MALIQLKAACRGCISGLALILGVLLATGCGTKPDTLPFYNTADFTAEWITPANANYSSIHTIDTFALQNQLGHTITKDSLDGHIYVANFFFTSCLGICPKMAGNLQILQHTYAGNQTVKLVSFSVMPGEDSVARLREYGRAYSINPNKWYLLTGSKERIYQLGRQSYFSQRKAGLLKGPDDFLHTDAMLLVDKKGRIRGIYNATDKKDIARVTENINRLLAE